MPLLSNIHTHTTFSDGRDAPEAMVRAALRLGFHTLGFSEHGHADYDDCSMPVEAEPRYRAEISRLRARYAGQIAVLMGYEHDWLSPPPGDAYDYVIESVHYIRAVGGLVCVDNTRAILEDAVRTRYAGDVYALCRDYFRTVCDSCASPAAILGHMELIMKFNERRDLFDDADPRYLSYALEAADCAAASGKLIEVNTGAIARGYRTAPYPGRAILARLAALRAPVIITSDCHNAEHLNCHFEETAALLIDCGFKTALQYRGGAPEEYLLEEMLP